MVESLHRERARERESREQREKFVTDPTATLPRASWIMANGSRPLPATLTLRLVRSTNDATNDATDK
jgi:hypothetical protein